MTRNSQRAKVSIHNDFWGKFHSTHRSIFSRYLFSILISFVLLIIIKILFSLCGAPPLISIALLGVILSCIYGGKGPALISTFITAFGVEIFYISANSFSLHWGHSLIRIIVYGIAGVIVGSLVESLKKNLVICRQQTDVALTKIKEKEEILSVVSHDLKVPLTSVLLSASILNREAHSLGLSEHVVKLTSTISNSAKRMNKLIEDLLDSVRIDSDCLSLSLTSNNIVEIIHSCLEESQIIATQRNIKICFNTSEKSLKIQCDRERLIQAISNIISNAHKFSPDNSLITIVLKDNSREIMISIQDQGCGISPTDVPKLFDKFWQVQDTAHLGTGLGLFIAHKIIEMHRGRIEVESVLEEGSTFKIYLPKA